MEDEVFASLWKMSDGVAPHHLLSLNNRQRHDGALLRRRVNWIGNDLTCAIVGAQWQCSVHAGRGVAFVKASAPFRTLSIPCTPRMSSMTFPHARTAPPHFGWTNVACGVVVSHFEDVIAQPRENRSQHGERARL